LVMALAKDAHGGRSFELHQPKIQFNGNLLVGKAYTSPTWTLKPGDEFEIKAGKKGRIPADSLWCGPDRENERACSSGYG